MSLSVFRLKIGSSEKQVLDGFYLGLRCNIVEIVPKNGTLFEILKSVQLYLPHHYIVVVKFSPQTSSLVVY